MSKKMYSEVFDTAGSKYIPDDVNLTPQILTHIQKKKGISMQLRLKISLIALAIVFLSTILSIGWPSVVQALQPLFGYLPSIGVVDQTVGPRKLAEPVSQTHDGVTVAVTSLTTSKLITTLHIKVTGIPASAYSQQESFPTSEQKDFCDTIPFLRYPDGTKSQLAGFNGVSFGSKDAPDYEYDWTVTPIPAKFDNAVFVISCLQFTRKGSTPNDWELPLHLVPMDASEFAPVTEITPILTTATSLPAPAQAFPDQVNATQTPVSTEFSAQAKNISIKVDKVAHLTDGDMVYAHIAWDDKASFSVLDYSVALTDAYGESIHIENIMLDASSWSPAMLGSNILPLQFKTKGRIKTSGPITLTVSNISLSMSAFDSARITFDAGSNPQVGQQWPIKRSFKVLGQNITFVSATRVADGYDFLFETDSPYITSLSVFMPDSADQYSSATSHEGGVFHEHASFDNVHSKPPFGIVIIRQLNIEAVLAGPWSVTWQP